MRWVRALAAVATLAALVVGAPWLLLVHGTAPSLSAAAWLRPDDGSLLLGLLTVVGWCAWTVVMLALAVELWGIVTGIHWRLPGLGWAQGVASSLLLAVVVLPGTTVASDAATPQSAASSTALSASPSRASAVPMRHAGAEATNSAPPHASPAQTISVRSHLVQRGESLWSIAEKEYGDGMRWRDILAGNRTLIKDPQIIEPGWELALPGLAAAMPQPAMPAGQALTSTGAVSAGAPVMARDEGRHADTAADIATPEQAERNESVAVSPIPESDRAGAELSQSDNTAAESDPTQRMLLGVGALLAGSALAVSKIRQQAREPSRAPGRRFVDPPQAIQRLEAGLGVIAAAEPTRRLTRDDLRRAQQAVSAHCRGGDLPDLDHVRLGDRLVLAFVDEPGLPPRGFRSHGRAWIVDDASNLDPVEERTPLAWPSLVTVGESNGQWILVDPAAAAVAVDGHLHNVLAGWLLELDCGGTGTCATSSLEALVHRGQLEQALVLDDAASVLATGRRRALEAQSWRSAERLDPDRAPALQPVVLIVDDEHATVGSNSLEWLSKAPTVGCVSALPSPVTLKVRGGRATLRTRTTEIQLRPQLVDDATLDALCGFLGASVDGRTEPAWWWEESPPTTDNVTWLAPRIQPPLPARAILEEPLVNDPAHPTLNLLGPLQMLGCRGPEPVRAQRQCVEYAAWILENPGATASQMADALLVAEATRRSNMSRLRGWLGRADDGELYLPEAYSGHINLAPEVTSDWQRFCLLLRPGVNRVSGPTLVNALDLVRGAPLADASPTGWFWAETMRADMRAMIRDAAHRLTELALDDGDLELARWASARGLAASPVDELLLCDRLRTEHVAGDVAECERIAFAMDRHARSLGVDLAEDTVALLQEVMEGSQRARRIRA